MKTNLIPLSDYVEAHTQGLVAQEIGCSQGAIALALKSGREIYVLTNKDGEVLGAKEKLQDWRTFPSKTQ